MPYLQPYRRACPRGEGCPARIDLRTENHPDGSRQLHLEVDRLDTDKKTDTETLFVEVLRVHLPVEPSQIMVRLHLRLEKFSYPLELHTPRSSLGRPWRPRSLGPGYAGPRYLVQHRHNPSACRSILTRRRGLIRAIEGSDILSPSQCLLECYLSYPEDRQQL